MSRALPLLPVLALLGCEEPPATPLGVTLDDGQVLIGDVTTDTLVLEGALGAVEIPLDDIGMILPVEGRTLGDSTGHVTVWLRNGSELKGEWAEPELTMGLMVGGERVPAAVPTERMQALQLQGTESWPSAGLFRVRTTWGDDFLVDPESTRVTLENELGTFSPFLSECRSIGPVGEPGGEWRVELLTGTVLVGPLRESEIAFALPMGPEEVVVPLAKLVALGRDSWSDNAEEKNGYAEARPMATPSSAAPVTAEPALKTEEGWFDNRRLRDAKR